MAIVAVVVCVGSTQAWWYCYVPYQHTEYAAKWPEEVHGES